MLHEGLGKNLWIVLQIQKI